MSILDKKFLRFDEEDVKIMKEMMKRFYEFHHGAEMPDWSTNFAGYLPVFAIALLVSQESVDKLTKRLIVLTWILAILTLILVALTSVLVIKG
jgi:hypothetical protein